MELIYLYIEDDGKNIKDCEFNFSPEYRFHYDKDENSLSIEKNENYISNFWEAEKILNITAVIGKNGSGKSNLLGLLSNILSTDKQVIYVRKTENGSLSVYSTIKELRSKSHLEYNYLSKASAICTPTIFYSTNICNSPNIWLDSDSIDISIKSNIVKDSARFIRRESIYANNIWLYHKYSNTIKQLEFLNDYTRISEIKLPKKCFVRSSFMPLSRGVSNNKELYDFADKLGKFMTNCINTERGLGKTDFEKIYLYASLIYELYCYCLDTNTQFDWGEPTYLNHFARTYIVSAIFQKRNDEEIGTLLMEIIQLIESIDMEYVEKDQGFLLSFYSAQKLFNKYFKLISIYREKIELKRKSIKEVELHLHKEVFEQKIDIEWEYTMSAGEQMYLNFYANIYHAFKKINIKTEYLYLIFDEPEIAFHPEWQRNFISNLINFISEVFTKYKVQIILTSHSPILVSDFPKNNIIFLDKDEFGNCKVVPSINQENTFGANIHTLYRNSFFLEGIPIGEFAKKKINKLFKELQNEQTINDGILTEIQLIGEPLIRDQLIKLYNQKKGLPENTERRIKKMEEEIKILKSRLNDKN